MSSPARPRVLLIGGPDVHHRLELMDALAGDFECAAAGSDPALAGRFAERGYLYRAYPLDRRFNLAADAASISALTRVVDELRPDLVHAFDTKPAVVGRLAAHLAGVGAVVGTLPGLGSLYTYATPAVRRRRAVYERLHRLASRVSDATVLQNRDDLNELVARRVVSAARAVLIPGSGVSRGRFQGVAGDRDLRRRVREDLGIAPEAPVTLTVARLVRAKGLLDLVRAAPAIRQKVPGCRLLLAGGEDPGNPDALTPTELALAERELDWLGERRDVPALLAAADLFVFPSFYREGLPRVLVEAAFAGVPIVTTRNPGCREVVEDGISGALVPPRRPDRLAAAVTELLTDRGRALRFSREAGRRALERFELGAIAREHRRLYHRLLEESHRRPRQKRPPSRSRSNDPPYPH